MYSGQPTGRECLFVTYSQTSKPAKINIAGARTIFFDKGLVLFDWNLFYRKLGRGKR